MTTLFILLCICTLTYSIRLPKHLKKLFLNNKPQQNEVYSIITWDDGEILWDDTNGTVINDLYDDILLAQGIKTHSLSNTSTKQFINENYNIVNLFKENLVNLDNILDSIGHDLTETDTTILLLSTYSLLLHMENKDTGSISFSNTNTSDNFNKQKILKILALSMLFLLKNPKYCS